ncbi:NADP-dependent oxidoreductase, partial [Streptomyces sp. NPDC003832]
MKRARRWAGDSISSTKAVARSAPEMKERPSSSVRDAVQDIDVVLDPLSGETRARSLDVLRPGGV